MKRLKCKSKYVKEILLSPRHSALKGLPTKAMTENPVNVSELTLKQTESSKQ